MHWSQVKSSRHYSRTMLLILILHDRFAEVEAVAVLTLFVMKYRLRLKEEPQHAHETFEQKKTRILAVHAGLTTTYVVNSTARAIV